MYNQQFYLNQNQVSNNGIIEEAFIDKLKDEVNLEIGFDWNLLKRDELYVNLIHFDYNITNKENYGYYNKFKVDVVGGYLAMDNIYMLQKYLEALKIKKIPFIVLSSGSGGKDVIPICQKYPFIKEVIIFCGNYNNYKEYLTKYAGYVKKIFVNISQVYNYIKSLGLIYKQGTEEFKKSEHCLFSPEDIKMNKQLEQCPVISAYEYDKLYFLVHSAYAYFFGDMNDKEKYIFPENYYKKIKKFINESEIIKNKVDNKNKLIKQIKSLVGKDNFVELSIRQYTGETDFCYIFNRIMRNFEKGLISLAYYMGPFLFAVNKYVKENPYYFKFNKNMTLYRNIQCSIFDYYLYRMNLNHIICFPSITSTSTTRVFHPTKLAQKVNNNGNNPNDLIKITMIFIYEHQEDNISPGIIVLDNKGKDGSYLSKNPKESEVILFPFTFARIISINRMSKTENIFEIYLKIINRNHYIEYTLKDNVEKRLKFDD